MQSKLKSRFIMSAVAATMAVAGITAVQAEGSSSAAEVQRGVPGMDIDMNKDANTGLNVDLQAGNQNDADNGPDTSTLGAGPADQGQPAESTDSANASGSGMGSDASGSGMRVDRN